ncbi:hypothetical protein MXB_3895 [Myxobolus squamalis]|nr:hypothetical protein MXB_3895 [Myxobolus squamalis]
MKEFLNILENKYYQDNNRMCSFMEWIEVGSNYSKNVCDEAKKNMALDS